MPGAIVINNRCAADRDGQSIDKGTVSAAPPDEVGVMTPAACVAPKPSMSPELTALLTLINVAYCDLLRLSKATVRTAVELGQRLGDLLEHAPPEEWLNLVRKTAVNAADAGSLVLFAEGRHPLIERLSPVNDVRLREALTELVALGSALTATAGGIQPASSNEKGPAYE